MRPAISADGARVSFTSLGTDLAGADANAANDVYVRDPASLLTRRASVRADGTTVSNTDSERSAIAGNGGLVAFVHSDVGEVTKLVAADANNQPDVFAKEFAPTRHDAARAGDLGGDVEGHRPVRDRRGDDQRRAGRGRGRWDVRGPRRAGGRWWSRRSTAPATRRR